MAKLTAWLGLDGKNFNLGIDGAKRKTKGLKKELKGIKSVGGKAFAFFGLSASITAIKGLVDHAKKLREESGISLIDDQSLDSALGLVSALQGVFAGLMSEVLGQFANLLSFGQSGSNVFADLQRDLDKAKEERKRTQKERADLDKLMQDREQYSEQKRLENIEKEKGAAGLLEELLKQQEETTGLTVEAARRRFELEKQIDSLKARVIAEEEAATKAKIKKEEDLLKKKQKQEEKAAEINAKAQQKIEDVQNKEFTSRFAAADQLTKMGGGMRFDPMIAIRDRQLQVLEDIRDIQEDTQREIERLSRGEE